MESYFTHILLSTWLELLLLFKNKIMALTAPIVFMYMNTWNIFSFFHSWVHTFYETTFGVRTARLSTAFWSASMAWRILPPNPQDKSRLVMRSKYVSPHCNRHWCPQMMVLPLNGFQKHSRTNLNWFAEGLQEGTAVVMVYQDLQLLHTSHITRNSSVQRTMMQ